MFKIGSKVWGETEFDEGEIVEVDPEDKSMFRVKWEHWNPAEGKEPEIWFSWTHLTTLIGYGN